MNATGRWPTVLALAGLLLVTAGLLIAVTSWPVDDLTRPVRAGYYHPLPSDMAASLRSGRIELVAIPEGQPVRVPLMNGDVDVLVNESGGYVTIDYVPARRSSIRAMERIGTLIQRYNSARVEKALRDAGASPQPFLLEVIQPSSVSRAPESWHLFFGFLTPLLLLSAVALGVALAGDGMRRRVTRGALFALAVVVELFVLLPFFEFHATTAQSSSWSSLNWLFPWKPTLAVLLAVGPAISISAAVPAGRARWLRVAIAVLAAAMLALAVAYALDAPDGAPLSSQVPYAVTLPTLVLCAVASLVLDRWRGPADSAASR